MKRFTLLTVFSIFFISPKVNAENVEFSLSSGEMVQMSNCMDSTNIMKALSGIVINSPAIEPIVLQASTAGRMASICDLYVTGNINLRTAKKIAKNPLEFYDKNPSLKRDLDAYSKQPGFQSCQKIWQK